MCNNKTKKLIEHNNNVMSPVRAITSAELSAKNRRVNNLVKAAQQLLQDLAAENYVLSLASSGGLPNAVIHPVTVSLECDCYFDGKPDIFDLGRVGVGEMIAL